MSYTVVMFDTLTGKRRHIVFNLEWKDSSEFWWSEGNMACDCNRGARFYDVPFPSGFYEAPFPCGNERFVIPYIELEDGTRIEIDEVAAT